MKGGGVHIPLSANHCPSRPLTPQRSISFKTEPRPPGYIPPPRAGGCRRRSSKLWSETFDRVSEELSAREVKRQEVRGGASRQGEEPGEWGMKEVVE